LVRLIGEGEATHTRLDAQDVVVDGEHLLQRGGVAALHVDSHLGVINTREVAGAGGLVLLWLQSEGVGVDAGVGDAGVVHEWLILVEVLASLLLEAVLTVEHQLEVVQGTHLHSGDAGGNSAGSHVGRTLLDPVQVGGVGSCGQSGRAVCQDVGEQAWASSCVGQHTWGVQRAGCAGHVHVGARGGEVPHAVEGSGGGVGVAPDQLLHWGVEGQADGLGAGVAAGGDGVTTGVLHLLDQVLVTLLGEAATLLSVQVHVVGPHLEHLGGGAEVVGEVGGQVEVEADLVVLQGNQRQVQTGVAVEEEQQGQVHAVHVGGISGRDGAGCHLAIVDLVALAQEGLGVQAEPGLVVLVDALTTDGQLNGCDGTLSHPAHVNVGVGGGQVRGVQLRGLQANVHVADQIAVAGNGHGHTTGVGGGTVHRLLDVLHSKVGVALVHSLEKGHHGLTSQIHILSTVSNELHKSTGHFVLYYKKKI